MNRSNRQPRGFTVVELLVVVSIILLLVAIFLPALKQAELRSKEAVCAADMRSLSQIWIQYATESFGIYPDMSVKPDGTGGIVANYWSHQEWRTYWEEQWNVERSVWYSPTNPKWNRDGFYLGGANGVSSNHWVIARHMFTSSVMNTEAWWNAMQQSAYVTTDRVPSGTWSPDRQVFARRMNQKPFFDIMMTDLCREWNSDPSGPRRPRRTTWSTPTTCSSRPTTPNAGASTTCTRPAARRDASSRSALTRCDWTAGCNGNSGTSWTATPRTRALNTGGDHRAIRKIAPRSSRLGRGFFCYVGVQLIAPPY